MGKAQSKLSPERLAALSQKTRFTAKDLVLWHRGFQKDLNSPLTAKEFVQIYKNYFPFGDPSKYALMLFKLFDIDQDGVISFEDFIMSLDISAKGSVEEKLEWAFKLYDLDEDGYIGKAEMLCIVDAIYRMIGNSKSFPPDEATPELRVEKVFKMMDLDGDDKLSFQEFIEGSKSDSLIVDSLNLYAGMV